MKKLIIVATCLALMPFVKGCGGGGSVTEPSKDELERAQKAAMESREKMKKETKGQ